MPLASHLWQRLHGLEHLGLSGLIDPPKPRIRAAIAFLGLRRMHDGASICFEPPMAMRVVRLSAAPDPRATKEL